MDDKDSVEDTLEGKLHFFSETGTEGGHWAFQDSRFISSNTTRYSCKKCHLYWDKKNDPSAPPVFGGPPKYCSPNAHQFELICKEDWSYKGLHILKDGDQLTIYHPDNNTEVWSGVIALKQFQLFTEDAFGLWIHAGQIGIDRETWAKYFLKEYPAKLTPSKEHK